MVIQRHPLRNLWQLEVFLKVAELLSFSRAAERLFITQPAVSRQIKELERSVGTPLFQHRGRRVSLTPAGENFYLSAKRLLAVVGELESQISQADSKVGGRVVVGTSFGWIGWVSDILTDLGANHPSLRLRITADHYRRTAELVLEGRVGLAFVNQDPGDARFESWILAESSLRFIAAPDHPLVGEDVPPSALGSLPFIAYAADGEPSHRYLYERYLYQLGVKPTYVMEIGSFDGIKRAVSRGLGIGMMLSYLTKEEIADGRLGELTVTAPPCRIPLVAMRSRSRPISPGERTVLERIRVAAADLER